MTLQLIIWREIDYRMTLEKTTIILIFLQSNQPHIMDGPGFADSRYELKLGLQE